MAARVTYDWVLAIQRLIVAVPAHMVVPTAVLVEEAGVEGSPGGLLHLPLHRGWTLGAGCTQRGGSGS